MKLNRDLEGLLDNLQYKLRDAATTEDVGAVKAADLVRDQFLARLQRAREAQIVSEAEFLSLRMKFSRYYVLARSASLQLILTGFDEATVAIENIHSHLERGQPLARAVRDGVAETIVPRFLAMVCILAVFISAFFLQGSARALFVPLALAVGFSMVASYILSSTFVPVMSIWLLRGHAEAARQHAPILDRLRTGYAWLLAQVLRFRLPLVGAYLIASIAVIAGLGPRLGLDIFPVVGADQFRVRVRAADGTH
ncbi:MAG: efflux RND transporter permease subunit, partial [Myxococcales bacterium]|nr:efflux RND transporter permease subunit [Myxococcales bacterium]